MLDDPILLLLALPAILIALTIHEYAHGRAAYALGDPTASYMGRLSLNPLKPNLTIDTITDIMLTTSVIIPPIAKLIILLKSQRGETMQN